VKRKCVVIGFFVFHINLFAAINTSSWAFVSYLSLLTAATSDQLLPYYVR